MTYKLSRIISVFIIAAALILTYTAVAVEGNIKGDADGDGRVTVKDVTCIQKVIAKLPVGSSYSKSAADVDGNGEVNVSDAAYIQRWLVNIETSYMIGEQPTESATQPTSSITQFPTDPDGWGLDIFRP